MKLGNKGVERAKRPVGFGSVISLRDRRMAAMLSEMATLADTATDKDEFTEIMIAIRHLTNARNVIRK